MRFRSADHPAREAFGAYHDLYSAGSQVSTTGGPFAAEVTSLRLHRMVLFDRRLRGLVHERTARRVAIDGFEHFTLQLVLDGALHVEVGGDARTVGPGEAVLFDLTRPQRTTTERVHQVTLAIARELVPGQAAHGRMLSAQAGGLLGDFVRALVRRGPTIDAGTAAVVPATVCALLGAALGTAAGEGASLLRAAKRDQILAYIDAHLDRPDLDAARIAAAMGLSRSGLYRMMEPFGGVAARIQDRRLWALRRALGRRDDARPVRALAHAHGFASESHAHRSFRAAFGATPGEFRRARDASRTAGTTEGGFRSAFAPWIAELR